jgi:aminoglycoside 6'-N-acetyltransferase
VAAPAVTLSRTTAADADALRAIHAHPDVARFWYAPSPEFPELDDDELTRFTIRCDGEIAGLIQFSEERDPNYRCAAIDLFVAPDHHRRGVASAAIAQIVDHLTRERGHHRITIDPAAHNDAAIACYAKAGFRAVGTLHAAERDQDGDGWHDVLLMELVVTDR